ncbi:hypothetical protein MACK_003224 [Theileria orientalis]|uniref:Uncharacterized protein n=1 Tax=Theileria orientalis TaxID=68886 RepID=A0A976XJ18_THEOR|nr:hypothetical protein MACK_003224 [Theileria orientalis]
MGERSFDDIVDQLNRLSPVLKPQSAFPLPEENILDLTLISSASVGNDGKKEETGRTSENEVFLTDDQIFSSEFKEVKLDSKPLDFSETTPKSTSLESEISTPASKQSQSAETVNYSNFESAAFKEHITRDSLDSVAYLNLELDGPRTQTGKTPPPLAKPKEESTKVKNEFEKFYDNMYYTSLHGPPVVGAFILRNKDSRNEFMFKYPESLDPKRPGNRENLKATYSSESYTAERDHTAELQSALHLLPGLAFGSQKKDSLVDFVHFVLPTSSGNVLYGTSYVLQFTEKVETYSSLLQLTQSLRKEPGKKASTSYFDPRTPPPTASRGPLKTLKETGAKALEFFDSATIKSTPALKPESKEKASPKNVDLLDLSSPKKKGESEPSTMSSTLKELDFLNSLPVPKKTASGALTKKSEFKPFDFFNFDSTPGKSEETASKEPLTKAGSGSCDTSPQTTKAKVFSLIDLEDKDKKGADEEEKNNQENKLFGMFSDLNLKKNLFGDEEEEKKKEKDEKEKDKENKYEKKKGEEEEKQGKDKSDQKFEKLFGLDKNDYLKESKSLVKTTEEKKNPKKDTLSDLGYKTTKELEFNLAKRLGWETKSEEKETGSESARSETKEPKEPKEQLKGILKQSSKEYFKDAQKNPGKDGVKQSSKGSQSDKPKMSSLEAILDFGSKLIEEANRSDEEDSSSSEDSDDRKAYKLGLKTKQDVNSRLGRRLSFDLSDRTGRENKLGLGTRVDRGLNLEKDHKLGLERKLSGERGLLEQKGVLKKKVGEGVEVKGEGSGSVPQVKKPEPEPELYTRYYVAICLVYTVPFFGLIGSRLEYLAQTYFDNQNFKDNSLLLLFVEHINKSDKPEEWSYESLFFNLEYHFKPFSLSLSYSKFSREF